MSLLKIIVHISVLYGLFLIGSWIQVTFNLLIPGSIIGMLLLLTLLATKLLPVRLIEAGTTLLLRHMPFLFIPVTVGILNFPDLFSGAGLLLMLIALVSTVMVMISAGVTSQWLAKKKDAASEKKEASSPEQNITTGT